MDLDQAIRSRRMVRSFHPDPLPAGEVETLVDLARRAPSAGNTQAAGFVVLDRADLIDRYWAVTLGPERRERFGWPGLLRAPALILITTSAAAYVERYGEEDKAATGLGAGADQWAVPYWWVDAGAVAQNLLLLAVDRGWGACLFGPFDHEPALVAEFELDPARRLVATIALGRPDGAEPRAGRSATRRRPPLDQVMIRPARRS